MVLDTLFPGELSGILGVLTVILAVAANGALYGFVWETCRRFVERQHWS
jgi:hypothetical protein